MSFFEATIATIFVLIIFSMCVGAFNGNTSNDFSRVLSPHFDLGNYSKEFLHYWSWEVCEKYAAICFHMEKGNFIHADDLRWHQDRVNEINEKRKKESDKYKFRKIDDRRQVYEQQIKTKNGDNNSGRVQKESRKKNGKKRQIEWSQSIN